MAGDGLEDEGAVGGVAGDGADLVQGGCVGHEAVAADAPVGGLQAGYAAEGRRLADAAAGVGAQGEGGGAGRHRRRRAAAAAAGNAGCVPGVAGGEEGGVLGGRPHAELVHVALAQQDGALFAEAGHGGGIVHGDVFGQHPGGAGGGDAVGAEQVLDLHGHAGEGRCVAGGDAAVGVGGLLAGEVGGDGDVGGYPVVNLGDAVEAGVGELDAADLAVGQEAGGLGDGQLPELIGCGFAHDGFIPPGRRGPGRSRRDGGGR